MTAPASPAPSESPSAGGAADGRARNICRLWAIGLALLALAGVACWGFVAPYCQVRRALDRNLCSDPETIGREVARLGGPAATARKIRVYLMMSDRKPSGAVRRMVAVQMLEHCGEHGVGSLVSLLDVVDSEPPLGASAARVLAEIGPPAAAAVPALRKRLGSENIHLRCEVAAALWRITGERRTVIPVMIDTMRWGPTIGLGTPLRAGGILAEIGPEAIPALEQLRNELGQAHLASAAVADALNRIKAKQQRP